MKHIIRTLSLKEITVSMNRIENDKTLAKQQFSVITGRAVADIATFLEMVRDIAAQSTLVVCMQGDPGKKKWEEECHTIGFKQVGQEEYVLPFSGGHRHLLLFRKE